MAPRISPALKRPRKGTRLSSGQSGLQSKTLSQKKQLNGGERTGAGGGGTDTKATQRQKIVRHAATCRQATGTTGLLAALPTSVG